MTRNMKTRNVNQYTITPQRIPLLPTPPNHTPPLPPPLPPHAHAHAHRHVASGLPARAEVVPWLQL